MAASTWAWLGGTGASATAADWVLTSGAGNINDVPQPGDVIVVPSGTITDGLAEIGGQGAVTIQAGATISVTAAGDGIDLGQTAATTGSITVAGAAALLSVAGATKGLIVGDAGSGTLSVRLGGGVVAGPQTGGAINVGVSATGTGAITLSDPGSSLKATGQINVGVAGSGSLTVQNKGTVISGGSTLAPSQGIDVGESTGGNGTILATGTQSLLSNTGEFVVGDGGKGSLSVLSGGTVITTPGTVGGLAGLVIANTAAAEGSSVSVNGTGSGINVTGLLEVGAGGSGILQLSAGGTMTAGSLDAGVASTGVFEIDLSDPGTKLTLSGDAILADDGTGLLSVVNGATFSAVGLTIGAKGSGSGNVFVSGANSVINLTGALNIGTALGTGVLTVGPSASVFAPVINLLNGQVVLEGGLLDPTVLNIGGSIAAGGAGTIGADFVIDDGTIQAIVSGPNHSLKVLGTVLGGGTLAITGGTTADGTTVSGPGILQIGAGATMEVTGAVLNAAATTFTDTQGGTYSVKNSVVDVQFQNSTGVLLLDDIAQFAGTIATYHVGDAFVIAGGTLSTLGVTNGNTLTVHDSGAGAGAGGIDQIIFGSAINPATLAIKNGNTIVGSNNTIISGGTLEIASGPFALTDFNSAGTPPYTTLKIDAGVSVSADASDVFSGVTLVNLGTLNLTGLALNGATVAGSGAVTVDGTGASATISGGGAWTGNAGFVVGDTSAGQLLINTAGSISTGGLDVARGAGSAGDITVTGAKSALTNTGKLFVGDSGLGNLSIRAGGAVTTSAGITIANTASAGNSSIDVTGAGSSLSVTGAVLVGNAGLGALSVSQGATVSASSIDTAASAGGDGVITVSGTGSALNLTGSLTIGDKGAGEVSILSGATVTALQVTIGNASAASSGNLDIEGAGSELKIGAGGILNIGVAGGGSGVLTLGQGATLNFAGTIVESGHASFNNNGGVVDPDAVQFTTSSNGGTGLNQYDLYVENIGAIQVSAGTGTWNTPMVLTGTSVADAQSNIDDNGDTGQWQLSQGGTLIINANTVDGGQAIVFGDATDTLVIGQVVNGGQDGVSGQIPTIAAGAENLLQAGGFDAAIWGYQAGDKILFNNMIVASDSIVGTGNTLELFGSGNVSLGSLIFSNRAGNKALSAAGMQAAAAQILADNRCFVEGTLIGTAAGARRVEDLAVGDLVVTRDGVEAPIVWVGQRAVNCERHPKPETVWPVLVSAEAFGPGLPRRDLYLSPDHAVFVDGVLVPVKLLIDGESIVQVKRATVTYFHVELPAHEVILAEGLPVESYLDVGDRADFAGPDVVRLFPDFGARLRPEVAMVWETEACAELVMGGDRLNTIRHRVNASRAGVTALKASVAV